MKHVDKFDETWNFCATDNMGKWEGIIAEAEIALKTAQNKETSQITQPKRRG